MTGDLLEAHQGGHDDDQEGGGDEQRRFPDLHCQRLVGDDLIAQS